MADCVLYNGILTNRMIYIKFNLERPEDNERSQVINQGEAHSLQGN